LLDLRILVCSLNPKKLVDCYSVDCSVLLIAISVDCYSQSQIYRAK